MVLRVDVVYPGDERGNGLLRRVIYRMPLGRRGSALELVTGVERERQYLYTMLGREPGNDQTGSVRLVPLGPHHTRLHFEERYHLTKRPWRWSRGRSTASSVARTSGRCDGPSSGCRPIPTIGRTWSGPDGD